ncbi:MoxR family ATPase [Aquihabitans sp. G128]|uniref:AAA family ATPase n=1 Tax=Aquihabitans sp. G128 TaxID=2849779 RepID=UPI001C24ADF3|nr:MoxR family ATPase [Aquihabitans sp. G128]QXC63150.1 MoxR family ATPase [Aquihabitans sp. G128]
MTRSERLGALVDAIGTAVRGKREVVEHLVVCLLAEGHVLIEDVPGVGKTTAARALAATVGGSWSRIQFTPDLLPSDVTGVTIFNQQSNGFEFHEGSIFANIVIADEINRASPKTQSALLEVMEERQVSVDGVPRPVPRPFLVVATQNPVEMDGTYRLPEAQLDRFLMKVRVGYPDHATEIDIVAGAQASSTLGRLQPVLSTDDVAELILTAAEVHVAPAVQDYIVRLVAATREDGDVLLGSSPRGSVALVKAARAVALLDGRTYVVPEDVQNLAVPVLAHRLILAPEAELRGAKAAEVVAAILGRVPVPVDGG